MQSDTEEQPKGVSKSSWTSRQKIAEVLAQVRERQLNKVPCIHIHLP